MHLGDEFSISIYVWRSMLLRLFSWLHYDHVLQGPYLMLGWPCTPISSPPTTWSHGAHGTCLPGCLVSMPSTLVSWPSLPLVSPIPVGTPFYSNLWLEPELPRRKLYRPLGDLAHSPQLDAPSSSVTLEWWPPRIAPAWPISPMWESDCNIPLPCKR